MFAPADKSSPHLVLLRGQSFKMIDLNFHPIRKALCLSLNEMAVLKEIYDLSNNRKFKGWCIKSKDNLAESLDLSRRTIIDIIGALILKGFVERKPDNEQFLRPTEFILDLGSEKENWLIMFKSKDFTLISAKLQELMDKRIEIEGNGVQKVHRG